jgi:hypothetical protein
MAINCKVAPIGWTEEETNPFSPDGRYGRRWGRFCISYVQEQVASTVQMRPCRDSSVGARPSKRGPSPSLHSFPPGDLTEDAKAVRQWLLSVAVG